MATVDKWRSCLNEHPFAKILRENNAKESKNKVYTETRGFIATFDNDLFVWDKHAFHLIYYNLQNLQAERKERRDRFQVLQCTDCPRFDVEWLTWNRTGCLLALCGQLGITVVEIPQKFGKFAEFQGGRNVVSCKSTSIAGHYFSSHQGARLLQVAWHPASETDAHIVFLTSDNKLSIYSVADPQKPVQVLYLGDEEPTLGMSLTTRPSISSVLGDNVVAFDFGEPVWVQGRHGKHKPEVCVHPVYCVKGNGDVVVAYTDLSDRPVKLPVQGPLLMDPPAEDNYGNDACAIICLPLTPPVVVIATCDGRLHHCILIPRSLEDVTLESEVFRTQSDDTLTHSQPDEVMLHVYESVELELLLATPAMPSSPTPEDVFTSPVKLIKDSFNAERYHCCHAAGVHTVALPWVQLYSRFCAEDEEEETVPDEQSSVVEHLICTTPLPASPPSPILGLAVVRDVSLGSILLTLSSDFEFLCLRLSDSRSSAPPSSPSLLSSGRSQSLPSPLRRLSREPFEDRIRGILRRNTSNPLIKSRQSAELSQQECFQLLSRATQVFREEYIQKQDLARQEISRRMGILREQKERQFQDLEHLKESRTVLADRTEELAVTCEECKDKQEEMLNRIEALMRKFQARVPFLSDPERKMKQQLEDMEEKMETFRRSLEQLKVKQEYQRRQIEQSKKSSRPSPVIKSNQMQQLRDVLKEEGDEVTELMKKVNQLKVDAS